MKCVMCDKEIVSGEAFFSLVSGTVGESQGLVGGHVKCLLDYLKPGLEKALGGMAGLVPDLVKKFIFKG